MRGVRSGEEGQAVMNCSKVKPPLMSSGPGQLQTSLLFDCFLFWLLGICNRTPSSTTLKWEPGKAKRHQGFSFPDFIFSFASLPFPSTPTGDRENSSWKLIKFVRKRSVLSLQSATGCPLAVQLILPQDAPEILHGTRATVQSCAKAQWKRIHTSEAVRAKGVEQHLGPASLNLLPSPHVQPILSRKIPWDAKRIQKVHHFWIELHRAAGSLATARLCLRRWRRRGTWDFTSR